MHACDSIAVRRREIEALLARARWYRSWAEVAGNAEEHEARLRMADLIERRAREIAHADGRGRDFR